MDKIKFIAPTACIGLGFDEAIFNASMTPDVAFIGCDAGSMDGGPSYLGGDRVFTSRKAVKRDLRILLKAARRHDVPLLIGSSGGSGGNSNLEWTWGIVQEIAREESLHFKTALVQSEPDRDVLVEKLRQGRILPLDPAPPIDEAVLRDTDRIVAMAGTDVYVAALAAGANVVLVGRSTDASIFAAIPIAAGFDPGLCWHAAKIVECGAAAATTRDKPGGMVCLMEKHRFTLEPTNPAQRCSTTSVAAHAMYETGNPFQMKEPGGTLLLDDVVYESVSDRAVAVSGSMFLPAQYTVRLEGATRVGYQSMSIGGIRDPIVLRQLDDYLAKVMTRIRESAPAQFGMELDTDFRVKFRVYGRDGVLGLREPKRGEIGHEVGLMLTVVADTQEDANAITSFVAHAVLHFTVPEWQGSVSNIAFPISPHVVDVGAAYRFTLNHVVELDDPLELFNIRYEVI